MMIKMKKLFIEENEEQTIKLWGIKQLVLDLEDKILELKKELTKLEPTLFTDKENNGKRGVKELDPNLFKNMKLNKSDTDFMVK